MDKIAYFAMLLSFVVLQAPEILQSAFMDT